MDQDLRDKVIETHTLVETISARLKKIDKLYEDLEKRVRRGELFRAGFIGLLGTGTAGGSSFAIFKHFIGG